MLSYICMIIGISAICTGSILYIKQYMTAQATQKRQNAPEGYKAKTDPGAYLCELAERGYISFTLFEGKVNLVLKNYPASNELKLADLYTSILGKHTRILDDSNATVGREIVAFDEIKNDYLSWIKRKNPGGEKSAIYVNKQPITHEVKTKYDRLIYVFIVIVLMVMFSVSDQKYGIISAGILEEVMLQVAVYGFTVTGIIGFRQSNTDIPSDRKQLLKRLCKNMFFALFSLFFGVLSILALCLFGAGIPMTILKVVAALWTVGLLIFQNSPRDRKGRTKKQSFRKMLKPEYIVDSRELTSAGSNLLTVKDKNALKNQMYMVEKELWDVL